MTFEDLQVFILAARSGNLSEVARQLGCTQPAVSQHIVRLEKKLGMSLLERRARGVALTDAGKVFYEHALEGLDAIEFAVKRVREMRAGKDARLAIATGNTTVRHLMKDAVTIFQQRYPHTRFVFHSSNSHQRCIDALRNEQADLAFVTMGSAIRGLDQRAALRTSWVLVVPKDDHLTDKKRVTLATLKKLTFIKLKPGSTAQAQLEAALGQHGFQPQVSAEVDDWDTAILLVGMGMGYAITPAIHAQKLARQDGVAAIPINGLPALEFGWAARRWDGLSKVASAFVEVFHECWHKQGKH